MITAETAYFMQDKMCINVDELKGKVEGKATNLFARDIYKAIQLFTSALLLKNAKDAIFNIYTQYSHLHDKTPAHEILDSMRHAFTSFADGGLHQLYTRQENEVWYPKIILTSVLEPNDIETLDDNIKIYRGCDINEFRNNDYGQAWSTSFTCANDFAFKHYEPQPWFDIKNRVVLEATVSKQGVLFSQQHIEFEVAVNTNYLRNIQIK